ncbi:AGAP000149-PA-like protein [Anopheles sinensis]|uniref:AGAP000149-PA-like protein n=1 Tax=Anopheles sinensis TaxID=74873 RepID=A0A084WFP9_ANOSI|nr:AGAP000149-PA-like protein [Anopheles sinensis]
MWKCHKCGKPVFFAERKQSLGYDWHPECLRCEECGKRLNPGQHAEHKGVPYCHVPCYGALFGPQLFGHGTRVESHKSFGQPDQKKQAIQRSPAGPTVPRGHLETKLRCYNQFHNSRSMEIRSREVNGRLVLEGALRIYWGVQGMIHLKEDDDQRTVVTVRKRNSYRQSTPVSLISVAGGEKGLAASDDDEPEEGKEVARQPASMTSSLTEPTADSNNDTTTISESISYDTLSLSSELNSNFDASSKPNSSAESSKETSPSHAASAAAKYVTLPPKLDVKQLDWDEIDELLQVERKVDGGEKLYRTMPSPLPGDRSLASESSITDTDYKTLTPNSGTEPGSSSGDSSDRTTTGGPDASTSVGTTTDDEFRTPEATLRSHDYEAFKRQISREFANGAAEMGTTDGTLKLNQPIDPARINDSLKLYNDGVMNRSLSDEQCRNVFSLPASNITGSFHVEGQSSAGGSIDDDDVPTLRHPANGGGPQHHLQRSHYTRHSNGAGTGHRRTQQPPDDSSDATTNGPGGGVTSPGTDTDSWTADRGLLRSKSQGNHYSGNSFMDSDADDAGSETLKPSAGPPASIHIRMDCYDELESVSSSTRGHGLPNDSPATAPHPATATAASHEYSTSISGHPVTDDGVVLRKPPKTGSTAIKRRSGNRRSRTKLKRRCSINGHFYNRETSFFTPPYGSQMNVWVTSLVNTQEVINLLLEKYKVESRAENFALFIVRDNGEQKKLKEDDYPLVTRVILGPHEDIAKLFLMDGQQTQEISSEVAQFLNLSIPECRAILGRYHEEEQRELHRIRLKFAELRKRIIQRMESLKVRL